MTATEILRKHGQKPSKNVRAKIAVEKAVKDHAKTNRTPGVDPIGDAAQKRTVANDKSAVDRTTKFVDSLHPIKEGSRTALMSQAKEKGIKYFRILTKENLRKVLDPAVSAEEVNAIIAKAKEEWKAGWGSKKKVSNVSA